MTAAAYAKPPRGARVLLVGAGGLGSAAILALGPAVEAGLVSELRIVDDDVVTLSNLHRQVIYSDADLGLPKASVAAKFANLSLPGLSASAVRKRFVVENAMHLCDGIDVVLDGSDNFATKFLVNDACVFARVPFVHAAAVRWQGQYVAIDPRRGDPCFRCLFETPPPAGIAGSCTESGVAGPVVGVIGALAMEAAVTLFVTMFDAAKVGIPVADEFAAPEQISERISELNVYDGLAGSLRSVRFRRNVECSACGKARAPALNPQLYEVPAC